MGNLFPQIHAALPAGDATSGAGIRPLADELPYLHCGSFGGFGPLHLLSDDTLGFAFTFPVPVVDTVPDGEQSISDGVCAMIGAMRPGAHWQWFLHGSNNVEPALQRYQSQPGTDVAGRMFGKAFLARWRAAQGHGFFPNDSDINFHPRSQWITVALKSAPLGMASNSLIEYARDTLRSAWRQVRRENAALPNTGKQVTARIDQFVAMVRDVLSAAGEQGWNTQAVDSSDLIRWLAGILFPQYPCGQLPVAGPVEYPLAANEIRTAISAIGRVDGLSARGFRTVAAGAARHHRVVSMLWQPRAVFPGMLNVLPRLRPVMNVCITASAQSALTSLLQIKARSLLNARSTHRLNETEMHARSEALREVEERIFSEGERIIDMRLQVHVCEETAELADDAARAVCKHLGGLEMPATAEDDIGSSLLLRACLPFAIYGETEQKLRRRRRLLSRDCADLHPAGGCWTGIGPDRADGSPLHPGPIVMYSNALGEPLFIDPTKAEKNPHALVVGQSGSGKSFFVHDYLLHLWRLPQVRLFLISIKADYRKLALLLGKYIEVSLDSEISLNPFCGAPNRENQARWFAALELMLTQPGSDEHLTREAEIALQGAALAAAQHNWDAASNAALRETVLEDVCIELERTGGISGRQLAARLHPYRRGPYARLFNAPRGVTPTDRFVFFNLGNVLRLPCAALASFCIFSLIDETMTDPELRAVPKGLIADEVWALVKNAHAAAILERSLKAYRSLGGFAIPIVQDPQDLDTPSGRVMLVNTATKIILPMDRSGQTELQRFVRLNEREAEIVANLRLYKRCYSEFFISIDGMLSAKGLLIPDPLRYAIATTDPVDEHRIEQHFRQSGNMLDAVQSFAKASPYGRPQGDAGAPIVSPNAH